MSCLTLHQHWVPSSKDFTAFYYCSRTVTPLQHLSISHCISIVLGYYCCAGSSVLSLAEPVFLCYAWCFSSIFRSLLPCFPHLPVLHEALPDPLLHVPYCAPCHDSPHRKAWLFSLGCSGGQGLRSGEVREVPRSFEGDKIQVHFQALPADAFESSPPLLLVFCSWSSPRSETRDHPTP